MAEVKIDLEKFVEGLVATCRTKGDTFLEYVIKGALAKQDILIDSKCRLSKVSYNQNKNNGADKKENGSYKPKYKIGDWVVMNNAHIVSQIVGVGATTYDIATCRTSTCRNVDIEGYDECTHKWSFCDARKGDFLSCETDGNLSIVIFDKIQNKEKFSSSASYYLSDEWKDLTVSIQTGWLIERFTPASFAEIKKIREEISQRIKWLNENVGL